MRDEVVARCQVMSTTSESFGATAIDTLIFPFVNFARAARACIGMPATAKAKLGRFHKVLGAVGFVLGVVFAPVAFAAYIAGCIIWVPYALTPPLVLAASMVAFSPLWIGTTIATAVARTGFYKKHTYTY